MQATRIERQDVVDAVAERVESQGKVLEDAIAIDVTLLDKDGNEIQPNGALNVCFFDANVEGEEVGVYRVSDDASQVETIGAPPSRPRRPKLRRGSLYYLCGGNVHESRILR